MLKGRELVPLTIESLLGPFSDTPEAFPSEAGASFAFSSVETIAFTGVELGLDCRNLGPARPEYYLIGVSDSSAAEATCAASVSILAKCGEADLFELRTGPTSLGVALYGAPRGGYLPANFCHAGSTTRLEALVAGVQRVTIRKSRLANLFDGPTATDDNLREMKE